MAEIFYRIEIHKAGSGYQIQVFEYPKDVRGERINADDAAQAGDIVVALLREKEEKDD